MVIDSSAVIAILLREAEAKTLADAIEAAPICMMSAANLLETSIVIEGRLGDTGGRELDLFLYRAGIDIVAVDQDQAEIARRAWRLYGKGRHPAGLNYGDCFAYALAKATGTPLLFKGNDFSLTDVKRIDAA